MSKKFKLSVCLKLEFMQKALQNFIRKYYIEMN